VLYGAISGFKPRLPEMSIFFHRKPTDVQKPKDLVATLRSTLRKLEAEAKETPRIADLKRIIVLRIAELEGKQN
jgi:hypothetical protein